MVTILNINSKNNRRIIAICGISAFIIGLIVSMILLTTSLNENWKCFAGYCPESKPLKRNSMFSFVLAFYLVSIVLGLLVFLIKQNKSLTSLISSKPVILNRYVSPLTLSEWFISMILLLYLSWKFINYTIITANAPRKPGVSTFSFAMKVLVQGTGTLLDVMIGIVMIPASRNSFLTTHLKIPYEIGLKFHKFFGFAIFYIVILHFVFYTFASIKVNSFNTLIKAIFSIGNPNTLNGKFILFGTLSFIFLIVAVIPCYKYIRSRHFNTFYYLHAFLLLTIVFAILHSSSCLYFAIPGMIMWIIDISIRIYTRSTSKHLTVNVKREPVDYYFVTVETEQEFKYFPGQYVFMCIPSLAKTEYHPFSLCGNPNTKSLQILIQPVKKQNEWTDKAIKYLTSPTTDLSNLKVTCEGPFGNWLCDMSGQDYVVCIATGSGIAPIIGIVRHAMLIPNHRLPKIIILWSIRHEDAEECSFLKEIYDNLGTKVSIHIFNTASNKGIKKMELEYITTDNNKPKLLPPKPLLTTDNFKNDENNYYELSNFVRDSEVPLAITNISRGRSITATTTNSSSSSQNSNHSTSSNRSNKNDKENLIPVRSTSITAMLRKSNDNNKNNKYHIYRKSKDSNHHNILDDENEIKDKNEFISLNVNKLKYDQDIVNENEEEEEEDDDYASSKYTEYSNTDDDDERIEDNDMDKTKININPYIYENKDNNNKKNSLKEINIIKTNKISSNEEKELILHKQMNKKHFNKEHSMKPHIHCRRMNLKKDLRYSLIPYLNKHKTAKIGMFLCANEELQNNTRLVINQFNKIYPDVTFDIHSESYSF